MRLNRLFFVAGVLTALLWMPFFVWAQTSPYGGHLVMAVSSDPKTFNDIVASETSSAAATGMLFEGLTTIDASTLKVIPNLAYRWEVSADGRQWIFHLRWDVRFFDGAPLTADDVVFTFNDLIYNPSVPSSFKDIFSVEGKTFKVEKLDAHTVRFTLPVKFAPFLRSMTQPILPKHRLTAAVQDGSYNHTWGINTPPRDIIGTGPFYLVRYRPGESLTYKRNPKYWKKDGQGRSLPYLDQVTLLIISDPDAMLLKFMDGELDSVGLRGMDYALLKPLEKQKNFKIYDTGADFGCNFITFNQNARANPKTGGPFVDPIKLAWFTNVHFRRAVAMAMDRPKMIEIISNGFGYPQYGPMSPSGGFFYNPDVTKYEHNLPAARKMLGENGFLDRDGDGTIEDAQGHPVEFSLSTSTAGKDRDQMAGMIRADLAKLGIKANIQTLEFNTLVSKLMSSYDWDAVIIGLTGGVEPHFGQNVWLSGGQLHLWNPKQEKPATQWEQRLDEIFTLAVQELDEDRRKILYDEWQSIAASQLPVIYTVLGANLFAVRQKFGNLKPTASRGAFHNLEEIYLK